MGGPTRRAAKRSCPWCSAKLAVDTSHCPACGAALAQRESIGDLVIPGVTAVEPALKVYAAQPLHLPGPFPSQSMTGRAIVAATLLAAEYVGAGLHDDDARPGDLVSVGRPGDAALEAVERLEREEETASSEPRPLDESRPERTPPRSSQG
jgi:hypothetical protein